MFRKRNKKLEVLLAHPGGPFFQKKDDGVWTVPKGEPDEEGEDLRARARIEFEEEVGLAPPSGNWIELGTVTQKGGKIVHAWAVEGNLPDDFECRSNTFEMEWPPRSGKMQSFPEVDRVCFFPVNDARHKLKEAQTPFLDRLETAIDIRR